MVEVVHLTVKGAPLVDICLGVQDGVEFPYLALEKEAHWRGVEEGGGLHGLLGLQTRCVGFESGAEEYLHSIN